MFGKVTLLNPPILMERIYGRMSAFGSVSAPTGLCYLAAELQRLGYEPTIIDAEALGLGVPDTATRILDTKPDFVGITCKTLSLKNAGMVAALLKATRPDLPIIVGGNHVTARPLESLAEFPEVDYVVVGEGERTLPDLLLGCEYRADPARVDGIAYRSSDGPVCTRPRRRIAWLDDLPPPAYDMLPELKTHYWPLFNNVDRYPALSVLNSRGCHGKCKFCDRGTFGNRVTRHSPEYVVTLLKYLRDEHGIRYFVFDDDNFASNRDYLWELTGLMRGEGFPFTCESRVDMVNPEMLGWLKRAGCRRIMYGIESGCQRMLDAMGKGINLHQIRSAVAATKAAGIKTFGYFMLGFPGETEDSMWETVEFIRELKLFDVGVQPFAPMVGSSIYPRIREFGQFDENWSRMGAYDEIPFVANGLTEAMLREYVDRCYAACYQRAYQYLGLYRRLRSWRQVKLIARYLLT